MRFMGLLVTDCLTCASSKRCQRAGSVPADEHARPWHRGGVRGRGPTVSCRLTVPWQISRNRPRDGTLLALLPADTSRATCSESPKRARLTGWYGSSRGGSPPMGSPRWTRAGALRWKAMTLNRSGSISATRVWSSSPCSSSSPGCIARAFAFSRAASSYGRSCGKSCSPADLSTRKIVLTRFVIVSFVTLVTASCTLGPDYRRPVIPTPDTFRGADSASEAGAASLADLRWSELFRDDVLTGLVTNALRQNFDVRIAAERVLQARAGYLS